MPIHFLVGLISASIVSSTVLVQSIYAQAAYTSPLGVVTYQLSETTNSNRTSYISLPLTGVPVYAAPIQSFTSNTVTFAGSPLVPGQLAVAGDPYFALFVSGNQKGRAMLITANSTSMIALDTTDNTPVDTPLNLLALPVANGDIVQIYEGQTLATFFGNSVANLSMVTGGVTTAVADNVLIYNPKTAKLDAYFFNTSANQWRKGTSTQNYNDFVIYPQVALGLQRRPLRPATIGGLAGSVPIAHPMTKYIGFTPTYTGTRYPVDLTLGYLATMQGWGASVSFPTADGLSVYDESTQKWKNYYLNGATWYLITSGAPSNSVYLPAGGAINIYKRGATNLANPLLYVPSLPYQP